MLFKDSKKLAEYAEVTSGSINFISVTPTLKIIEKEHIIATIGKELYAVLNTAYLSISEESSLSQPLQDLLEYCRSVIGPMLGYYYAPLAEIKLSDAGARREETNSSKTAFQYQITNFRKANLRNGEGCIELLLEFLEENKEDYAEWTGSDAFTNYRKLFIKTGKEFNEYFPSHSPYRNYWAMRAKMFDVEQQNIRKAIGDTLFDALKAKSVDADGTFTDKEEQLLLKLKKSIANLTVAFSIPFLSVRIDVNGLTVVTSSSGGSQDDLSKRQNVTDNQVSSLMRSATDAGQSWLNDAVAFLKTNSGDFSDWKNKDEIVTDDCDDRSVNDDLKGSFSLC